MKIEIGMVEAALKKHDVEPVIAQEILADLKAELDEAEEKAPPVKKQYVIVVSDPQGTIPSSGLVGWAVQIEEGLPPSSALEKVNEAAAHFNSTPKGFRLPVNTVGEAMEVLPPKITRELGLWIKTKEPVYVVTTLNRLTKPIDSQP